MTAHTAKTQNNDSHAGNPILKTSPLPNQAPLFEDIRTSHYLPAVKAAIEEARANIEAIKNNPQTPGFENTVVALETAAETLSTATSLFYNRLSSAGDDELQALTEKIGPLAADFSSDIILDPVLYEKVKTVYEQRETLTLPPEQQTLLEDTYKGFVRGGAALPEDKKEKLRDINQKLSVLGPAFMNNVKKSSEQFTLWIGDRTDLAGLPESAIDSAASEAEERGQDNKWLFTLDYPSYGPFITYAENRALREKIWRAYNNRAYSDDFDNTELLLKTVKLRDERARLLGYKNHAAYVLEHRMAEKPETVMSFLNALKDTYLEAAQKDLAALRAFAKKRDGLGDIKPWDVAYYSEKLKEELFKFSSEDLRPYFPLYTVITGCFSHFSRLFGLEFKKNEHYQTWHKDVTGYDVVEKSSGRFIGTLYTDVFPRAGKKNGAWKTSYRSQGLYHGKTERPVIAIVCNFTKPTNTKPSLLTHGEVLTLFHEMGHAVHGLLSDVTYPSLAGTSVKWDFVELPSQVQENWCFEKETLDMISGHYETGEKIPAALIEKLNKAKNFMVGWSGLRQVNFALLDMAWHTTDPATIKDVAVFEDDVTAETSLFSRMAGPFSVAFNHLFAGGYAAGYYSYKWAEVLDADTFELFLDKGLYDPDTATRYKNEILSKGGSEHPKVLYHRFRGRDADPQALLRREGLLPLNGKIV